jgi:hypothetical protein
MDLSLQSASNPYETNIQSLRQEVLEHPATRALLDPHISPVLLERFLIEWCALGVQVTEPVEGWIRRAGARCEELGLPEIGRGLQAHAKHEANHHLMFIEDTRALVARWNERRSPRLDADALLAQPMTPGMRDYIELHERTIAGTTPYAQVAIEYEVEGLSVRLLPLLMAQFRRVLGDEVMSVLSFLNEHAELDVGHTNYNRKMMQRLMAAQPHAADLLVETGAAAVRAYLQFLGECLAAARVV